MRKPREDPILGCVVEICSSAGIVYRGIVRTIWQKGEFGELFELGCDDDTTYRRLVFVTDRRTQIYRLASDPSIE
jgi:hypothetical protein